MDLPENVVKIIREAAADNPSDIPKAVDEAERRIKRQPDYDEFVCCLVRQAILELVYDARHASNTQTKRDIGYYGGPAKVNAADSSVERVYRSVYAYNIGSTTLGEIMGRDIAKIQESERAIADGHLFNAELLEWLKNQGVTEDKKVKDVVPEKKLRGAFDRIYKRVQKKAA